MRIFLKVRKHQLLESHSTRQSCFISKKVICKTVRCLWIFFYLTQRASCREITKTFGWVSDLQCSTLFFSRLLGVRSKGKPFGLSREDLPDLFLLKSFLISNGICLMICLFPACRQVRRLSSQIPMIGICKLILLSLKI